MWSLHSASLGSLQLAFLHFPLAPTEVSQWSTPTRRSRGCHVFGATPLSRAPARHCGTHEHRPPSLAICGAAQGLWGCAGFLAQPTVGRATRTRSERRASMSAEPRSQSPAGESWGIPLRHWRSIGPVGPRSQSCPLPFKARCWLHWDETAVDWDFHRTRVCSLFLSVSLFPCRISLPRHERQPTQPHALSRRLTPLPLLSSRLFTWLHPSQGSIRCVTRSTPRSPPSRRPRPLAMSRRAARRAPTAQMVPTTPPMTMCRTRSRRPTAARLPGCRPRRALRRWPRSRSPYSW